MLHDDVIMILVSLMDVLLMKIMGIEDVFDDIISVVPECCIMRTNQICICTNPNVNLLKFTKRPTTTTTLHLPLNKNLLKISGLKYCYQSGRESKFSRKYFSIFSWKFGFLSP